MTAPAIRIEHLVKTYPAGSGQTKRAVNDATFDIPAGQIVSFLGPNGAGKTTTLRMILGLARPTSGSVQILGHDATKAANAIRQQIGYLPDVPGFPAWMTAPEFLRFAGSLFGIDKTTLNPRIDSLLDLAGLTGVTHKIGGFSRGMKQRLGIAQALVNAPKLLMLDEPTSALDPLGRRDVLTMIEALRGKATVLFSTHLLDDVERVCDSAVVLNQGHVLATGTIAELRSRYGGAHKMRLVTDGGPAHVVTRLQGEDWASEVTVDDDAVVFAVNDADRVGRALPGLLASANLTLREYRPALFTLEDAFVRLTEEDR